MSVWVNALLQLVDYFVISDTKLDPSFASAQFHIGDETMK